MKVFSIVLPQAQQLPAPVTSASKMKLQRHQLYLLKDEQSNGSVCLHVYVCCQRWLDRYKLFKPEIFGQ